MKSNILWHMKVYEIQSGVHRWCFIEIQSPLFDNYAITVFLLGYKIHKPLLFLEPPSGRFWGRESAVHISSPFNSELYLYF